MVGNHTLLTGNHQQLTGNDWQSTANRQLEANIAPALPQKHRKSFLQECIGVVWKWPLPLP